MACAAGLLRICSRSSSAKRFLLSLACAFIHLSSGLFDKRCYSCMSLDFKEKWKFVADKYYPPLNFTDACNEPMEISQIGLVPCKTACVMICEASYIGGQFAGYNYIRGCLNRIARNGFNNRTVYKIGREQRDLCHRISRSQLFSTRSYVEDQVTICICHRDRCNSSKASSGCSSGCHKFALLSVPLTALLWSTFRWHV